MGTFFGDFGKQGFLKQKSSTNFVNFVTGGKALVKMPRGKKQKSPEEEQELLEDLYTNRNFSAPAAKALETITEAEHSADDSSPTKALQPAAPDVEKEGTTRTRKPRGAASRARASMAPKEVRRLDFVPYNVADKERDRRRVQRAAKVAKSKGKKPVKFQGLSGEQEDKLQKILYEKREEEEEELSGDEEETRAINRAIDKVLIRAATSAAESTRRAAAEAAASTKTSSVKGPLQPNPTSSSATKRVNMKRRRSSASFKRQQPSFLEFPDFNCAEEELSADPIVTKRASRSSSGTDTSLTRRSSSQSELPNLRLMESPSLTSDVDPDPAIVDRRASLELAIAVADAEFGPIDDGTSSGGRNNKSTSATGRTSGTPRQTPNASSRPSLADVAKRTVNVRRSSRFFRQGASSNADGSVGSVFTEVEVAQKIDRRKSRRTHFVVFEQPEEPLDENSQTREEGRKSSFSKGKPTETENLLQPESSIKDGGSFDNPQQHVRQPLSPIENFSS